MREAPKTEFVRPPTEVNGPVLLSEPDPAWPATYAAEEFRIRWALGEHLVRIEHVGSTSVPGLAAKPILDILLLVPDPTHEWSYVLALERVGYARHLREPGWYEHRLLKHSEPTVNLHVFGSDCPEADQMLLFRDWLRNHLDDRLLYESVKRQLAARHWARVQDYADAKTDVVREILARAAEPSTGGADGLVR